MSDSISILSPDLASQIAAGEVVERPASVAKELIENALDAGASRISVEVEGGGLQRLQITDNGHGIRQQELALAITRHATSKLRQFSELEDLLTYGFRGEALPSIASVSRLKIESRHLENESGYRLSAEGTTEAVPEPVGHPVGTSIEVVDLFFNVPARRKFLKSANTEAGHISEVLLDAALCRPDVSFQFKRDGRVTRKYPLSDNRAQRVQQVLTDSELLHLKAQKGPLQIEALLCNPQKARRGTQGLRWVINGRPVKDRALSGSVAHAFGGLLERGFYPKGVIYLDLPGHLMDINVHPQKTEVRFSNLRAISEAIHGLFQREIEKKYSLNALSPQKQSSTAPTPSKGFDSSNPHESASFQRTADIKAHYLKDASPPPSGQRYAREEFQQSAKPPEQQERRHSTPRAQNPNSQVFSQPKQLEVKENPPPVKPSLHEELKQRTPQLRRVKNFRNLRFRYQAKSRFLVCENEEGIFLLNQSIASELVYFAKINQALHQDGLTSQRLLFPQSFELSSKQKSQLESPLFSQLGIDLRLREEGDEKGLASLHALPELLKGVAAQKVIDLIFDCLSSSTTKSSSDKSLANNSQAPKETNYTSLVTQLASLASLQPGREIGTEAANVILADLAEVQIEASPRHKKLISHFVSWSELERKAGEPS